MVSKSRKSKKQPAKLHGRIIRKIQKREHAKILLARIKHQTAEPRNET